MWLLAVVAPLPWAAPPVLLQAAARLRQLGTTAFAANSMAHLAIK